MKRVIVLIMIISLFFLSACSNGSTPQGVYESFVDKYGQLPVGTLYDSEKKEWEDGYVSDRLVESLYGCTRDGGEMEHVLSFCVYLSSRSDEIYELGIFLCNSHSEAEQVAKMCLLRIDTVKEIRIKTEGEVGLSSLDGAFVRVSGKFCVYSIMPDNEASSRALDRAL